VTRRLHVALFDDAQAVVAAARALRAQGIDVLDVVSPHPIHGLDEVLGIPRSRLTWVCLIGGVTGLALGLWFQYWASATSWPLNVGGKPFDSLPAFVPVAFEMTVLFAGLATAAAMLARGRLWPGRRARPELEATTDAGFVLIVARSDAAHEAEDVDDLLRGYGARSVRHELEEGR